MTLKVLFNPSPFFKPNPNPFYGSTNKSYTVILKSRGCRGWRVKGVNMIFTGFYDLVTHMFQCRRIYGHKKA